jgi:hypothetical protein
MKAQLVWESTFLANCHPTFRVHYEVEEGSLI